MVLIPVLEMVLALDYSVEVLWKEKEVSLLGRRKKKCLEERNGSLFNIVSISSSFSFFFTSKGTNIDQTSPFNIGPLKSGSTLFSSTKESSSPSLNFPLSSSGTSFSSSGYTLFLFSFPSYLPLNSIVCCLLYILLIISNLSMDDVQCSELDLMLMEITLEVQEIQHHHLLKEVEVCQVNSS